jgi:hypothetical protein
MLSVQVPPAVSLALLEGDLGREISAQLSQIPTHVCLGDDGATRHVADTRPAYEAWRLLKKCDDIGWVIAGKLLARKRPRLIPVYDWARRDTPNSSLLSWEAYCDQVGRIPYWTKEDRTALS